MKVNHLFQVLDRLPEPRLVLEATGAIIMANSSASDLLAPGGTALAGKVLWEAPYFAISPEWKVRCEVAVREGVPGETVLFDAAEMMRPQETSLEMVLVPVSDEDAHRELFLAIFRNVTESRAMAQALSRQKHLMDAMTNAAPVYVAALDRQRRILFMNVPMAAALGFGSSDELLGKDYVSTLVPLEQREKVVSFIERAFDASQPTHARRREAVREVAGRLIEWHPRIVHDEKGEEHCLLVVGLDVTGKQEAERVARDRGEQLSRAMRLVSLGTLLSSFTHEVNSLNGYIQLNAQNLAVFWKEIAQVLQRGDRLTSSRTVKGISFERARDLGDRMIEGIIDGSRRFSDLVSELKAWARHEQGRAGGRTDVNSAIMASLRLLDGVVRSSTVGCTVDYGKDLPLVPGTSRMLEVVISNLLRNACQALTDRNQRISILSARENDGWVSIRVRDEGEGISPADIDLIFDPFFTTKGDRGGTGLGLSLSVEIVRHLGGTVTCRSTPGQGAEFVVRLPPAEMCN